MRDNFKFSPTKNAFKVSNARSDYGDLSLPSKSRLDYTIKL